MSDLDPRGGEQTRTARVAYRIIQALARGLAKLYFRYSVIDRHNMPRTGAFIISPNHRSNLDVPLTGAVSNRRLRYFAKDSLFTTSAGAWFLTMLGGFPVARGSSDRGALRAAQRVLERGEPLAMFPEGERKSGPVVQPLFDGVAYVASRAQVPVLPVGIGGTERAMPKGAKIPRPRRVVFIYGDPVDPPPMAGRRVDRKAMNDFTAELHERIQGLFDEAQRRAGTPNDPPSAR